MTTVRYAVNPAAFHWYLPELIADREGFFREQGLLIEWNRLPKYPDKTSAYVRAMADGITDFYHCGEWVAVARLLISEDGKAVAKSPPGDETLNSSFTLFARKGSDIRTLTDLKYKAVAVEEGTGSKYNLLEALEPFVTERELKLVNISEPHKRFQALIKGTVDAAVLLGPWNRIAKLYGMIELVKLRRTRPTVLIVSNRLSDGVVRSLIYAINKAIKIINKEALKYNKVCEEYLLQLASEIGIDLPDLSDVNLIDKWNLWEPYTYEELYSAASWMLNRKLIDGVPSRNVIRQLELTK
ncbi:MAG: hypothetical protein QXO17_06325 [Nitrososphaerota archaeon]|nr:hypothetical protein [Candidatus Calditenuis fumarioli]